jgi:adenosylcobinamide-GDP ribazoletransferase
MKRLILAFQFLTIIPLGNTEEVSEQDMGKATAFFPVVGAIEGILYVSLSYLFLKVFPTDLTNGLLLFAMVIINGGLHLDGLSDTVDAVASRGDREKKLSIMKDSTVGPAGVIAIVLVLLLKYLLLNAVAFYSTREAYYSALYLLPVLSRWTMVPAIYHCSYVRDSGLGKMFITHTELKELIISTMLVLSACIVLLLSNHDFRTLSFVLMFMMPVLYIFSRAAVAFFGNHFGGMTGDSFGSVYEIAIILFLMSWVIWSQKFIS